MRDFSRMQFSEGLMAELSARAGRAELRPPSYLLPSGRKFYHGATDPPIPVERTVPGTAVHLACLAIAGQWDERATKALKSIADCQDRAPQSPTRGCFRWYAELPEVMDTNAAFFTSFPLLCARLSSPGGFPPEADAVLEGMFREAGVWFGNRFDRPAFYYPNPCLSNAACLLGIGAALGDEKLLRDGEEFARRWFDFLERRGCGWGEDHSPGYSAVLGRAALLIVALATDETLREQARDFVDELCRFARFHDGFEPVPAIRSYNFAGTQRVKCPLLALMGLGRAEDRDIELSITAEMAGYRGPAFELAPVRYWRRRTFDEHFSTSYVSPEARLGTLSEYPLMPNTYQHATSGLGWQSMPAGFHVGKQFGFLQWLSVWADGTRRAHPKEPDSPMHMPLFDPSRSHLPDVVTCCCQHGPAAIIMREIHRLDAELQKLEDRWVMPGFAGRLTVDRSEVEGEASVPVSISCEISSAAGRMAILPVLSSPVGGGMGAPSVRACRQDGHLLVSSALNGRKGRVRERFVCNAWAAVILRGNEAASDWQVS